MTSTKTAKTPRTSRSAKAASPALAAPVARKARRAEPAPAAVRPPSESPAPAHTPKGKLGIIVGLLRRPQGARIAELSQATGWLAHSVRGAMAGALKARGYTIVSAVEEAGRVYCITLAAEAGA